MGRQLGAFIMILCLPMPPTLGSAPTCDRTQMTWRVNREKARARARETTESESEGERVRIQKAGTRYSWIDAD